MQLEKIYAFNRLQQENLSCNHNATEKSRFGIGKFLVAPHMQLGKS
jgi:hypothetical protein